MSKLGEFLSDLKYKSGLSYQQIGQEVDLSRSMVCRAARGHVKSLSEAKLIALAKVFGVDSDKMLAMAGKIASDTRDIILSDPTFYGHLIRTTNQERKQEK